VSRTKAEKESLKRQVTRAQEEARGDEFFITPRFPMNLTKDDLYYAICQFCDLAIDRHYSTVQLATFKNEHNFWACSACAIRLGWITATSKDIKPVRQSEEYAYVVKR
jgi:hypothetical protein